MEAWGIKAFSIQALATTLYQNEICTRKEKTALGFCDS